MFKKIIIASAILAATAGVAQAAAPAPYVGAGLGIVNNSTNSGTVIANAFRGVPFNVFAGYGGVVSSSFYLAGELNATVGTATITDNSALKTSYAYGVSLIPGYMLSDNTMAFARVGVERAHFTNLSNSNRTGGQFGLGMQTALTQNLDVRGEYDFTAFQSRNSILGASLAPRQDAFNLSLVYKIN